MFCKLFESKETGQVLVQKTTSEDGNPYLAITFDVNGIGYATIGTTFTDSDKGIDALNKAFDEITEDVVISTVLETITMFTAG